MSGRKVFTAGEVLQAADVNDFLMDQSVMVFAGTAARGSAIPSPSEGMVTYLSDSDEVEVFDGSVYKPVGAGQILQVVSTTLTSVFSESVAANGVSGDVTGLTASVTPASASNKVLVSGFISVSTVNVGAVLLFRGATQIALGDAAGSRTRATSAQGAAQTSGISSIPFNFLDSPSTTSATTYSLRLNNQTNGTTTLFVNRSADDGDVGRASRPVSTITLTEVAG